MVIVVRFEVYIICSDAIKINPEQLCCLFLSKRDEGTSMWPSLDVAIHICPPEETWKVLEDPCMKIVHMKISKNVTQVL